MYVVTYTAVFFVHIMNQISAASGRKKRHRGTPCSRAGYIFSNSSKINESTLLKRNDVTSHRDSFLQRALRLFDWERENIWKQSIWILNEPENCTALEKTSWSLHFFTFKLHSTHLRIYWETNKHTRYRRNNGVIGIKISFFFFTQLVKSLWPPTFLSTTSDETAMNCSLHHFLSSVRCQL